VRKYTVVIGDSRDMHDIPDKSVNLVCTSPPYWNLDVFSDKKTDVLQGDLSRIPDKKIFFSELTKVWRECNRVLKLGGYLMCEWEDYPPGSRMYNYPREISLTGEMIKSIEDAGPYLISRWIWQKHISGSKYGSYQYILYKNLEKGFDVRAAPNWAYCFVFRKPGAWEMKVQRKLDFTQDEWVRTLSSGVWYIDASVTSGAGEFISGGAVYPEELIRRFIRLYTSPGDTVLDPFLGTGTTMVAAFNLRRSCIGYEIRTDAIETIKQRVNWEQTRTTLDGETIDWKVIKH
jgi:site-specific DNA-methyltransferase (adenine-specific)